MEKSIERMKELEAKYSNPVMAMYELKVFRDGGLQIQEHWHVFVANLQIMGDGATLDEAIDQVGR